jgi:pimeloyl-ACP methyl ester carboxylesterase
MEPAQGPCCPPRWHPARHHASDVDVPVLLAWSDDDRVFPRRLAERLAATLPDARVATVPDSAAFSALDNPDVLVGLVREVLVSSGLPGGAAGEPHRGSDPAPPARADAP